MPTSSDRNLLFGILALQMDFVSRNGLIEGMKAWLSDRFKPIGQLLVERGELNDVSRSLLEPLVDEHIRHHGGDASQSLASLTSDAGLGIVIQKFKDADLSRSLETIRYSKFLQTDYSSSDDLVAIGADRLPEANVPFSTPSRYQILRQHAEGGLGRIYVALDQELNREVAFKEIRQDRVSSKEARDRFRIEAEITGALEHPGIVPVYGLGQCADGRPFYAMRFIRGQSLLEAIRRFHKPNSAGVCEAQITRDYSTNLVFRDIIKRLIDVCNTMQYAHDRGVLHRDLKPENIMLGKYGETLVVDWGLARAGKELPVEATSYESPLVPISGSDIEPTQHGQAMGTLGYMSPEQAEGKLDKLGPSSDVYSLGATLYAILTGEAPLRNLGIKEMLARLQSGDIPLPRSIQANAPKALEAVCLKAMAVKPSDRYLSAGELTTDLEAWLADQPVSAYREPFVNTAGRWIRHHTALVSTITSVVFLAAIGTCISVYVSAIHAEEIRLKNVALIVQIQKANQSETTAIEKSKASQAINEFLVECFRKSSPLVESRTITVFEVLDRAIDNLKRVKSIEPAQRCNLALAVSKSLFELGEYKSALDAIEFAISVLPAEVENELRLSCESVHAIILLKLGNSQAARELINGIKQERGKKPRQFEAEVDDCLAQIESSEGNYERAFEIWNKTIASADTGFQNEYPSTFLGLVNNLANEQAKRSRYAEAQENFQMLLELGDARWSESDPRMLTARNNLAVMLLQKGEIEEAAKLFQRVVDMRREILGPEHIELAGALNGLGRCHAMANRFEDAESCFVKAIEILKSRRLSKHADSYTFTSNLGNALLQQRKYESVISLLEPKLAELRSESAWEKDASWSMMSHLSESYIAVGQIDECQTLLTDFLTYAESSRLKHRVVCVALYRLSFLLMQSEKWELAEMKLLAATELIEELNGSSMPVRAGDIDRIRKALDECRLHLVK